MRRARESTRRARAVSAQPTLHDVLVFDLLSAICPLNLMKGIPFFTFMQVLYASTLHNLVLVRLFAILHA